MENVDWLSDIGIHRDFQYDVLDDLQKNMTEYYIDVKKDDLTPSVDDSKETTS